MDTTEEGFGEFHWPIETSQTEMHRIKRIKQVETPWTWGISKIAFAYQECQNEKKENMRTKEIFEIIKGKIFPKLIADTKLQIQEAQRITG